MRKMPLIKIVEVLVILLLACAVPLSVSAQQKNYPVVKEYRIERSIPPEGVACIECHRATTPGLFADWAKSRHANANIGCLDCHLVQPGDTDIAKGHDKYYSRSDLPYGEEKYKLPIASIVTPKDCSRCHPDEAKQYSRSKHANTIEIMWKLDPWLNKGMNSDNERKTGCFSCHGTVIKIDENGNIDPNTWPNAGVGRINADGSKGACTSCHTRHRFSVAEARMPEACDQCHLGPDHPQIEIYEESKHGTLYHAFKSEYNFNAAGGTWTAGVDYRAPTCAACHMSGSGKVLTSHDVTERLSWETQAPLTVRPENFKPFPSKSEEYNEVYFKPVKKKMDELYEKGLVDKTKYFDEHLELQYYEIWHHEGRRARMGAMMMAPDYAWWHGFYEVKNRYNAFMEEANHLLKTGEKAYRWDPYPNATGNTKRPVEVFPE
jgi:hypothetical protein